MEENERITVPWHRLVEGRPVREKAWGGTVCAVLLAAGGSTRMGADSEGRPINKLLIDFDRMTPIELCAAAFYPYVDEIVIAVSKDTERIAESVRNWCRVPVRIVPGGARRQDSVRNALTATDADIVSIHDCARCLVPHYVIEDSILKAAEFGSGVAAIPARDTLRDKETGETADRSKLLVMQTPQSFFREKLIEAYDQFDQDVTDDAALWQLAYGSVTYSEGDIMNQKLTGKGDVGFFARCIEELPIPRVGYGEDTHRLVEGRRLILGGVEIPFELGLLGHSDADALTHAVIDAMLGAAALGDIGRHFPDSDPQYKGICSLELLKKVSELIEENGFEVCNIDATVIAQKPKLAPFIEEMRANIAANIAGLSINAVSVKATTPEGTGPEGNLECITVRAVASLLQR